MIEIREATLGDIAGIQEVFHEEYGDQYAYPEYFDVEALSKLVYAPGTLLLVAIDQQAGRVAGTASVVFSVAAQNDLVGEFGRLVVHPEYRGHGLGKRLMQARIDHVKSRLHVGIVDNRTSHTFSQRISSGFGFVPIGFIPGKLRVDRRETIAQYVCYFGDALSLRRNNPRIIPEASRLASIALENCKLPQDAIVDDASAPYPNCDDFDLGEMQTEGYASLLRIERGRVRHRDVFGPIRLHYGLFQLQSQHSNYLIARHGSQIAGGLGYLVDDAERAARVFELISVNDQPIRFLLERFLQKCEDELGVEYIEIDVSAYSPRMQRTLLELGFLPVSYIPACVFHQVERLDAVKMSRLIAPPDFDGLHYLEEVRPIAEVVMQAFESKAVFPKIASASKSSPLFDGLSDEQLVRLMSACQTQSYNAGETVYEIGSTDGAMHLILGGTIDLVTSSGKQVASAGPGNCIGETSFLTSSATPEAHSLQAIATEHVDTAVFPFSEFAALIRRRPDIGVVVYRNLALEIGRKLRSTTAVD